jgi:FtsZ-binding cell division protein ZapB
MSEINVRTAPEYLGLRAKHTQLKVEHAALQGEVEKLKAEVASAKSEVETAKSKYDDSKLKAENQELKGKLRTTEHRKVFDRLAKERGVAEDALDDLWQLSGYQAAKDEVDEAAIGTLLDEQKTRPGRARLFGEVAETPTSTPGPGRGQGTRETKPNGKFQVTRAQLSDGVWAYENSERIKEATKGNTLEIID